MLEEIEITEDMEASDAMALLLQILDDRGFVLPKIEVLTVKPSQRFKLVIHHNSPTEQ